MKFRLRIVTDVELQRDPDKFYVAVACDRTRPDQTWPNFRPAQLEFFDEVRGGWHPIEIEKP